MEIYLVRHTSVDVPKGTCYGFTDVPLKNTFETEAAVTKLRLDGVEFDCAFTSPLSRAVRLAEFCGYGDAVRDDRLKEMNMGAWEMQLFDKINDPHLEKWYGNYLEERTTGGESFRDLYGRVSSFLDELRQRECRRAVVFAHGGVLLCAQVYAGVTDIRSGFSNLTPYGGVVVVNI